MATALVLLLGSALGIIDQSVNATPISVSSDVSAMDAELAAMRADLAVLRREQGEAWLSSQRASEIRALVSDVLADSSTRTQCAESGSALVSGYATDRGFYLGTVDGQQTARVFGFMQVRFVWNQGYDAAERDPSSNSV